MSSQELLCSLFRKRFLDALGHAAHTQERTLRAIVAANRDTWFGSHQRFASIRSIEDYQAAVPISTYEDLEVPVRRIACGEVGILTREPVDYLQYTSGSTTGQLKLIPSTSTFRHAVWQAVLASQGFAYRHARAQSITTQPGLMIVGTYPSNHTAAGIPCGSASARHASSSRHFWKAVSVAPFAATLVADPETRWYVHWRYVLMRRSLAYIGAPYMAPLLASAQLLFKRSDNLVRDLTDGTLSADLSLSSREHAALAAHLKPDRERAAELTKIMEREGGLIPRLIWPNLGWIFSVHGPTFAPYQASLSRSYAYQFMWGMPYLACEGIVGIPYAADSYSHLPAVKASFLEFIPEEEWPSSQPRTLLVTDLEPGRRYDVVLTGWNGIYRYRLGDIVEVDGEFCGMPTLRVISRLKTVLSISWEKTTEEHVVQAVEASARECGIELVDFVIDIDTSSVPARYCLWAEPADTISDIQGLKKALDTHLGCNNPSYAIVRGNAEASEPIVQLLPTGTFDNFRRYRQSNGTPAEQMKVLHSMTEWSYVRAQE